MELFIPVDSQNDENSVQNETVSQRDYSDLYIHNSTLPGVLTQLLQGSDNLALYESWQNQQVPPPSENSPGQSPTPSQSSRGQSPTPSQSSRGQSPTPSQSSRGQSPKPSQSSRGQSPTPSQSSQGQSPTTYQSSRGYSPAQSSASSNSSRRSTPRVVPLPTSLHSEQGSRRRNRYSPRYSHRPDPDRRHRERLVQLGDVLRWALEQFIELESPGYNSVPDMSLHLLHLYTFSKVLPRN
ncbi:cell wall protein RBR3-like isoform X2 [Polypterus senegalus]|uniref:cell wall protein RBR3-like isoform X2 n=1 Tax=Polypterus senegalus TaxID=55291 RepID=UPI0019641E7D|nr:cell wall protein RBR3-like isoform X2 [Polypterus senegalus]